MSFDWTRAVGVSNLCVDDAAGGLFIEMDFRFLLLCSVNGGLPLIGGRCGWVAEKVPSGRKGSRNQYECGVIA